MNIGIAICVVIVTFNSHINLKNGVIKNRSSCAC